MLNSNVSITNRGEFKYFLGSSHQDSRVSVPQLWNERLPITSHHECQDFGMLHVEMGQYPIAKKETTHRQSPCGLLTLHAKGTMPKVITRI